MTPEARAAAEDLAHRMEAYGVMADKPEAALIRALLSALEAAQADAERAWKIAGDAMGDTIKCPRDHDWRPLEMQAAAPREECTKVTELRAELAALAQAGKEGS